MFSSNQHFGCLTANTVVAFVYSGSCFFLFCFVFQGFQKTCFEWIISQNNTRRWPDAASTLVCICIKMTLTNKTDLNPHERRDHPRSLGCRRGNETTLLEMNCIGTVLLVTFLLHMKDNCSLLNTVFSCITADAKNSELCSTCFSTSMLFFTPSSRCFCC